MDRNDSFRKIRDRAPTPSFVVDLGALGRNLAVLERVRKRTGCRILLAQKGFAMFSVYPVLARVLDGTCASSPHEARLGREEFGGEVHAFAAAYSDADIRELSGTCDHIVFNSFGQWARFRDTVLGAKRTIRCGLRINPEHSEGAVPIYDPCSPGSRLGIRREDFLEKELEGISGLHFHTLCEQNADALARTLAVVEKRFGDIMHRMEWINFGGGHHITREDYDLETLCRCIEHVQRTYDVSVYLEPGEAVALNAGVLVTEVLDVVRNQGEIAILDTSAPAHMPDVLEMPYRPEVVGAGLPGERPYTCRLTGLSCLAGDVIGEYSFDRPLEVGDRLVFLDMAHYTMVKTTTFNGVQLPSILTFDPETDELRNIRKFGYEDFKGRLS